VISRVEGESEVGREYIRELYPLTGRAHVVGITGNAGSGKSTLTAALAGEFRRRGRTVAIVAVDPSSPFTQGAVLGDRIRMREHALDPGVYIRSMASRDATGGLAPALDDVVCVLDAFGFDKVLVETTGVGQAEVEISRTVQTTVLVNGPGNGDDIQALKAGVIEIADILVVSKADQPGADQLASHLRGLLSLSSDSDRRPPILKTSVPTGEGVTELVDAIASHLNDLESSDGLRDARRRSTRQQVLALARAIVVRRVGTAADDVTLDRLVSEVVSRKLDPHSAATELADLILD
jgi:LAO/AO transport system kinase